MQLKSNNVKHAIGLVCFLWFAKENIVVTPALYIFDKAKGCFIGYGYLPNCDETRIASAAARNIGNMDKWTKQHRSKRKGVWTHPITTSHTHIVGSTVHHVTQVCAGMVIMVITGILIRLIQECIYKIWQWNVVSITCLFERKNNKQNLGYVQKHLYRNVLATVPNVHTNYHFKNRTQKANHYTGSKLFIRGPKHHKEN